MLILAAAAGTVATAGSWLLLPVEFGIAYASQQCAELLLVVKGPLAYASYKPCDDFWHRSQSPTTPSIAR